VLPVALRVPNFPRAKLPRLSGSAGRRLQEIVRLGRSFTLSRRDELLLEGTIPEHDAGVTLGAN